jgi:hypothetical protein
MVFVPLSACARSYVLMLLLSLSFSLQHLQESALESLRNVKKELVI